MSDGQVETGTTGLAAGTPRSARYGTRGELIVGGDAANPIPVTGALPAGGAATDRTSTITLGGTAQNAMAANTSRKYWSLSNNSDTVMNVHAAGTASATVGAPVYPGQTAWGEETNAISVYCATTGKAFTAWEV